MRKIQEKIFTLLQSASQSLEQKKYENAEESLRSLLVLDQKDAWGWCLLGSALEGQLGKTKQAVNAFLKAVEIDPSLDWAQKRLDRLLCANPEDIEIPSKMPWMHDDEDHILNDLITEAKKLEDQGDYSNAKARWEEALKIDPEIIEARISIAHLVENYLGPLEDAESYYIQALEIDPNHDWAWAKFGLFLKKLERFAEAEDAFRQAVELDRGYVIYAVWLGWLLIWSMDRPDEGGIILKHAMKDQPDYIWGQIQLGRYSAWIEGDGKTAKKIFKAVCEADPANREAFYQLGLVSHQIDKDYKKAYKFYRKVTDLDPNDFSAWRRIIDILNRIPDQEDILEKAYHKIIEIDPTIDDHYTELALFLVGQKGREAEAEKYFKIALEVNDQAEWAWANLGKLYIDLGRIKEGENALRAALKVYPEYAWADYLLSVLYFEHYDDEEKAEEILKNAVAKAPESFFAHYYMALLLGDNFLQRPDEAYPYLVKALELDGEAELVLLQLIEICQKKPKTYDEASEYCKALLVIDDQNLENLIVTASHYLDYIWDFGAAYDCLEKYYNEVKQQDMDKKNYGYIYSMQAKCLSSLGKFDEAEALFEKAVKANPEEHYSWHEFGIFIYQRRLDDEKALEYLTKAKALNKSCDTVGYDIAYVQYKITENEKAARKDFAAAFRQDSGKFGEGFARFLEKCGAPVKEIEEAYISQIKNCPYNYVNHYHYSVFLSKIKGREGEAKDWFEKAEKHYPKGFDMKLDLIY